MRSCFLGWVICVLSIALLPRAAWAFEYRICVRPPGVAPNVAKWAGTTYFWHLLVDERLAVDLEATGATGLSFRSVYAVMPDKRQVKLRWKQICAERVLPRMSPETTGLIRDRACKVCDRNGYFETNAAPTRIAYRASDLIGADDVNMSWENVGISILEPDLRESLLAKPWMLVTPKIWRVFRDAGVTEFDWWPIRVVEP